MFPRLLLKARGEGAKVEEGAMNLSRSSCWESDCVHVYVCVCV